MASVNIKLDVTTSKVIKEFYVYEFRNGEIGKIILKKDINGKTLKFSVAIKSNEAYGYGYILVNTSKVIYFGQGISNDENTVIIFTDKTITLGKNGGFTWKII